MTTTHPTPQPAEKSAKTDHSASRSDIPTARNLAEWRKLDLKFGLCWQSDSFMDFWDWTDCASPSEALELYHGVQQVRPTCELRKVYLDNLHKGHKHAILAVAESERLSM